MLTYQYLSRGAGSRSASPVKRLSEILPLDIELEDGSLTVSGGIVTSTMLLQEGIKTVFSWIFLTAHEDH